MKAVHKDRAAHKEEIMAAVRRYSFGSCACLAVLAATALIAQAGAMPEWGAKQLSCGFTHALRTIKSVETAASASEVPKMFRTLRLEDSK